MNSLNSCHDKEGWKGGDWVREWMSGSREEAMRMDIPSSGWLDEWWLLAYVYVNNQGMARKFQINGFSDYSSLAHDLKHIPVTAFIMPWFVIKFVHVLYSRVYLAYSPSLFDYCIRIRTFWTIRLSYKTHIVIGVGPIYLISIVQVVLINTHLGLHITCHLRVSYTD